MNYVKINSAATTVCRSMPGKFQKIIVTGGTAGTITVYDHASAASGNIIADFDATNTPNTYFFEVPVQYGVVVVTGAATKITVIANNDVYVGN